jgi:hypothetical protein
MVTLGKILDSLKSSRRTRQRFHTVGGMIASGGLVSDERRSQGPYRGWRPERVKGTIEAAVMDALRSTPVE